MFIPNPGEMIPISRAYFSDGLKPPTQEMIVSVSSWLFRQIFFLVEAGDAFGPVLVLEWPLSLLVLNVGTLQNMKETSMVHGCSSSGKRNIPIYVYTYIVYICVLYYLHKYV